MIGASPGAALLTTRLGVLGLKRGVVVHLSTGPPARMPTAATPPSPNPSAKTRAQSEGNGTR